MLLILLPSSCFKNVCLLWEWAKTSDCCEKLQASEFLQRVFWFLFNFVIFVIFIFLISPICKWMKNKIKSNQIKTNHHNKIHKHKPKNKQKPNSDIKLPMYGPFKKCLILFFFNRDKYIIMHFLGIIGSGLNLFCSKWSRAVANIFQIGRTLVILCNYWVFVCFWVCVCVVYCDGLFWFDLIWFDLIRFDFVFHSFTNRRNKKYINNKMW